MDKNLLNYGPAATMQQVFCSLWDALAAFAPELFPCMDTTYFLNLNIFVHKFFKYLIFDIFQTGRTAEHRTRPE